MRSDRMAPILQSQLSMISQFLSVVSRSPKSNGCAGVEVDVIKTLVRAPKCKVGAH